MIIDYVPSMSIPGIFDKIVLIFSQNVGEILSVYFNGVGFESP